MNPLSSNPFSCNCFNHGNTITLVIYSGDTSLSYQIPIIFFSVIYQDRGKVEMDSDRTVSSNVRTTECKNVLVDVLRSENFALLCNVLCKTVHQDEERSRYFDFGVIDSRMKNGEYGCAPEMFKDDLKLVITLKLFCPSIFLVEFLHIREISCIAYQTLIMCKYVKSR
jgi:hypothetical protein